MKILNVRSKNSAASAHFIQGPRPTLRRKKRPRMNKERVQVAKRHRQGQPCPWPTEIVRRKSGMPLNTASQRVPNKKD